MNIQDWFPLGWTGWISLQSKGLSRVFSNTRVQWINSLVLSFIYSPILTSIHDYWKKHSLIRSTFVDKVMSLLFNMLSTLVTAFLPKWASFNFMVAITIFCDFGAPQIKSDAVSTVSPSICHEVMGSDAMILVFWSFSFKPTFSLFHFHQEAL